jgi:hypothetical protein
LAYAHRAIKIACVDFSKAKGVGQILPSGPVGFETLYGVRRIDFAGYPLHPEIRTRLTG